MKNITMRRFGAYLIDLVIIGIIGTCFSYFPLLNPKEEEYEKVYQDVLTLYERFDNNELTMDEYQQEYISLSYDLNRSNVVYTTFNLVLLVLYFVFVPFFMNGQTFGKKVLHLKVVSHQEEKVSIVSYFIRAIVQNNILITIAQIGIIFYFTKENYYTIYNNVNMVGYVLLYLIVFLVLVRKDKRGLHDLLSGTKVILVDQSDDLENKKTDVVDSEEKQTIIKKKNSDVEEAVFEEVAKKKSNEKKSNSNKKKDPSLKNEKKKNSAKKSTQAKK